MSVQEIASRDGETSWKKLLYIHQGFADNYVPPSFLEQLQTNGLFALFDG